MVVTHGQGNPFWTREEVILVLEIYHSLEASIPGPKDERIVNLSRELRSFPYHLEASKSETFRNPSSIGFKLQNIRQVATGRGLSNTARVDREVWEEFGSDKDATARMAAKIRRGLKIVRPDEPYDRDFEFNEGRAVTEAHKRIERSKGIREKLLKSRRARGQLKCDICTCDGSEVDESIRDSIFEAHHLVPLSVKGETKTRLRDMALLCANCHRLIHCLMSLRKTWVSLEEARSELGVHYASRSI